MGIRLAVDIGGTFVDAVAFDRRTGMLRVEKAPTTPTRPADGVLAVLGRTEVPVESIEAFVHGTTLGINALLERKGAATGIITNEGFRDIYEIGRTNLPRHAMYDIRYRRPPSLVPRRRRLGVPGRLDADGEVVEPLDEGALAEAAARLVEREGVRSLAICFLHSYQNPKTEQRAAELVRARHPGVSLSISSDIVREYREYERTSTVVLDAYIKPVFASYVEDLHGRLAERGFRGGFFVTRSGGGAVSWQSAKQAPIHTILSGPAGGLIGAVHVARVTSRPNLIAVDLGGTSLDACVVIDGKPAVEYEASLEHLPIMIPVYDIRTIGAGGGSIAWLDGQLLKVGPRSAGADPGPVCYGRGGTEPTVTDAALVLGYLDPEGFLAGEMPLDRRAAFAGIQEKLAVPMEVDALQAARGVIEVAAARVGGAVREITVERGLDPREFALLAYGGAGPMILPLINRHLGAAEIVVPQAPSVFSAWGMLMADVVFDVSQTHVALLDELDLDELCALFAGPRRRAERRLEADGFGPRDRRFESVAEMRYLGQEHTVPVSADDLATREELAERFRDQHQRRYGHVMDDPLQLVHLRVRGIGIMEKPRLRTPAAETDGFLAPGPDGSSGDGSRPNGARESPRVGEREAYSFHLGRMTAFDVRRRRDLAPGTEIEGPAIIQEPTATTVLDADQRAAVDEFGQIIITAGERA